jgi:hypothetical protein
MAAEIDLGPLESRAAGDRSIVAHARLVAVQSSNVEEFAASFRSAPLRLGLWLAADLWAQQGLLDLAVEAASMALGRRPDESLTRALGGCRADLSEDWLEQHWFNSSRSDLFASAGRRVSLALFDAGRVDEARRIGEGLENEVSRPNLTAVTGTDGLTIKVAHRPVLPDDPLSWMAHMWRWFTCDGFSHDRVHEALVWLTALQPNRAGVTVLDLALAAAGHLARLGHHRRAGDLARWLLRDAELLTPEPRLYDMWFTSNASRQPRQLQALRALAEQEPAPFQGSRDLAQPIGVSARRSRDYASLDPTADPLLEDVAEAIRRAGSRVAFGELVSLARTSWHVAVSYHDPEDPHPSFLDT